MNTSWLDSFCGNLTTVEGTVSCLDEGTFNLKETIKSNPNMKWIFFLDMEKENWTADFTSTNQGSLNMSRIVTVVVP